MRLLHASGRMAPGGRDAAARQEEMNRARWLPSVRAPRRPAAPARRRAASLAPLLAVLASLGTGCASTPSSTLPDEFALRSAVTRTRAGGDPEAFTVVHVRRAERWCVAVLDAPAGDRVTLFDGAALRTNADLPAGAREDLDLGTVLRNQYQANRDYADAARFTRGGEELDRYRSLLPEPQLELVVHAASGLPRSRAYRSAELVVEERIEDLGVDHPVVSAALEAPPEDPPEAVLRALRAALAEPGDAGADDRGAAP